MADVEHLPTVQEQAEQAVSGAVIALREDMPTEFILVYAEPGTDKPKIISHCSLNGAQALLDYSIRTITEQYAVGEAKRVPK